MKKTKIVGFILVGVLGLAGFSANLSNTNSNINNYKTVKNNILLVSGGQWTSNNGIWSYQSSGYNVTGWQQINGVWYYFNNDGAMQTGWQQINNTWYYFNNSGAMETGWQQINNTWYYFNNSGAMETGWQQINNVWYYFNSNGSMANNWAQINNQWYYLGTSGAMETGWQQINNVWYYFNPSGSMYTGWLSNSSGMYYLNSTGAMSTGWKQIKNNWYYFNNSGLLQTGWLTLDGSQYYLNKTGVMQIGWEQINGTWYNFNNSGALNPNATCTKTPIKYNMTMNKYVAGQVKEYEAATGKKNLTKQELAQLKSAINPADATDVYQFLNVAKYRKVNESAFEQALNGKGILSGHAQDFINAGKQYGIDPVYLMAQTFLESNYGTSNFANGIEVTQVQNSNGQIVKLKKPVKVYNLFGIGANNVNPTLGATSYAYYQGWTSISKAINGAAEFLANNYMHNPGKIAQDTPYEIRFINGTADDMWHQYSSEITYAQNIGGIMDQYSNVYDSNDTFEFQIPTFN